MSKPRFLVTAGNTREMIDRVRDWGNIFTGNTGYAIAKALRPLGEVDLLTSNAQHAAQASGDGIVAAEFRSHAQLKASLADLLQRHHYDAVFMTAAVADYRPTGSYQVMSRTTLADGSEQWVVKNVQAGKVKSHYDAIAILGERTEKIVDLFRTQWGYRGLLFKFKLEVEVSREQLLQIGQQSRKASAADYLVANSLDMVEGPGAGAYLLSDAGEEFIPRAELAERLKNEVAKRLKV